MKATNVRQKLAQARLAFLNENVKKTGTNMHLEFKYFELEDIVPSATRIFANLGLVSTTNFDGTIASMTIYNTDNEDEAGIVFTAPYREVEPIINRKGEKVTNAMQVLGSSITYLRRYLYMMALDIVEHDDIDATLGANIEDTESDTQSKRPATVEERKEAKIKLVSIDNDATPAQIKELKSVCRQLIDKDEKMEEMVNQIALKTDGFTKIKSSTCCELLDNLHKTLEEYGE